MSYKYVKSFDRTKIFYRIRKNKGPWIVFLHGWPLNHTTWKKELRYFEKKGFSTIALDLRGHGKSDKPDSLKKYDFNNFAKDINSIVNSEYIKKFMLVGHSFGGMVALAYYDLYPYKIKNLVLIDTIYENPAKHIPFIKNFNLTPLTEHILRFIIKNERIQKKHFNYVDFSKLRDHNDFFYWLKGVGETPLKSTLVCLYDMLNFNKKSILPKINVPTLIIEGSKDGKTPLNDVRIMSEKIKDSKLIILRGVSHDSCIRDPYDVEKSILDFIK